MCYYVYIRSLYYKKQKAKRRYSFLKNLVTNDFQYIKEGALLLTSISLNLDSFIDPTNCRPLFTIIISN